MAKNIEKRVKHGELTKDQILKFLIDELGNGEYVVHAILDEDDCFLGVEIRTITNISLEA